MQRAPAHWSQTLKAEVLALIAAALGLQARTCFVYALPDGMKVLIVGKDRLRASENAAPKKCMPEALRRATPSVFSEGQVLIFAL
jgi:hypothetical protein